jgi:hypothetical protein
LTAPGMSPVVTGASASVEGAPGAADADPAPDATAAAIDRSAVSEAAGATGTGAEITPLGEPPTESLADRAARPAAAGTPRTKATAASQTTVVRRIRNRRVIGSIVGRWCGSVDRG